MAKKRLTKKAWVRAEHRRLESIRGKPGITIDEKGNVWRDESDVWERSPRDERSKVYVYIDGTVVMALFDDNHPINKKKTARFLACTNHYEIFYSDITISYLAQIPDDILKDQMLHTLDAFTRVSPNEESEALAKIYLQTGLISQDHPEAAEHLAIANVYDMTYLATWDRKNVNAPKIREMVNNINKQNHHEEICITAAGNLFW